jgi:hypothetical protein
MPGCFNLPAIRSNLPADYCDLPADRFNLPADQSNLPAIYSSLPADRFNLPADQSNLPADQSSRQQITAICRHITAAGNPGRPARESYRVFDRRRMPHGMRFTSTTSP